MVTEDAFNDEVAVILEKMSTFNRWHFKHYEWVWICS